MALFPLMALVGASIIASFFGLFWGAATYAAGSYLSFIVLYLMEIGGRRSSQVEAFVSELRPSFVYDNAAVLRRYWVALLLPAAAATWGTFLNSARLTGFLWVVVALLGGAWQVVIAQFAFFFLVGGIYVRLRAGYVLAAGAQGGNAFAAQELAKLIEVGQEIERIRRTFDRLATLEEDQ